MQGSRWSVEPEAEMLWDLAVGAKKDRRSGARAGVTARRERRNRVGTHETADRSGVVVIRGTIWVWLEEEGVSGGK